MNVSTVNCTPTTCLEAFPVSKQFVLFPALKLSKTDTSKAKQKYEKESQIQKRASVQRDHCVLRARSPNTGPWSYHLPLSTATL